LHHGGWNRLLLVAYTGVLLSKFGNNTAMGTLRAFGLFDWHATLLLSSWATKLVVTVTIFLSGGLDVLTVLLVSYACDAIANAIAVTRAVHELRARHLLTPLPPTHAPGLLTAIRRFLLSGTGISLSDSLMRELDTTIVAWYLPLEAVGVYRMSKNILMLAYRGLDPVCTVLMPEFARLAGSGNYKQIMQIGFRATRILLFVTLAVLIGGALVLPYVVPMILGPQFAEVSKVTVIMLVGLVIGGPLIWSYALWVAAGRMGMQLLANVLGALCAGTLFVILTPRLAVTGAGMAFAVTVSLPVVLSFSFWQLRSRSSRPTPWP
jgi:O-antigen/teichoic acid export membrane protein